MSWVAPKLSGTPTRNFAKLRACSCLYQSPDLIGILPKRGSPEVKERLFAGREGDSHPLFSLSEPEEVRRDGRLTASRKTPMMLRR